MSKNPDEENRKSDNFTNYDRVVSHNNNFTLLHLLIK